MPSTIKPESKFIVYVDTNILWHQQKHLVANPDFEEFWDTHSINYNLKLHIPKVVIGELNFQHFESGRKLLDKAKDHLADVSKISQNEFKIRVSEDQLKKDINAKFEKWSKKKKAEIVAPPTTKIDWETLINDAIWRNNVFKPDSKKPDTEKGFRDRIILETVIEASKNLNSDEELIFICNDFLLRTSIEKQLSHLEVFSSFEDLANFTSYLKLTSEELTDKFIKSILSKARNKFFDSSISPRQGLFYNANVRKEIKSEFSVDFDYPVSESEELLESVLEGTEIEEWEPVNEGRWLIENPNFTHISGEKEFHWSTRVTIPNQFQRKIINGGLLQTVVGQQSELKTQFIEYIVKWKADVWKNTAFHNVELLGIQQDKVEFRTATKNENSRLGLWEEPK